MRGHPPVGYELFDMRSEGLHDPHEMLAAAILWQAAADLTVYLRVACLGKSAWLRAVGFWMAFDPLSFWEGRWSEMLCGAVGDAADFLRGSILEIGRSLRLIPIAPWLRPEAPMPSLKDREDKARVFLSRLYLRFPGLRKFVSIRMELLGREDMGSGRCGMAEDVYVLASRLTRIARRENLSQEAFLRIADRAARWAMASALGIAGSDELQIPIPNRPLLLQIWKTRDAVPFRFMTQRTDLPAPPSSRVSKLDRNGDS